MGGANGNDGRTGSIMAEGRNKRKEVGKIGKRGKWRERGKKVVAEDGQTIGMG